MHSWITRIALTTLTVATLLLPSATTFAGSSKLYVDDDKIECPTAAFTSIQAAIDAAPSGAEIRVCPGTYNEDLTISKKLTLRNHVVNNKPAPLLVGNGAEQVVLVTNTKDVTIRGLRITATSFTSGIVVNASPNVTVQNTSIDTSRFAIAFQNGSHKGSVRDNTITKAALGVDIIGSNQAKVQGNTVNNAFEGIHVQQADKTQVNKNTVTQASNGIGLVVATNTTVGGNTTNFNDFGVRMNHSTKNTFRDGTSKGNKVNGFTVDFDSSDNVLKDYKLLDNAGLDIQDFSNGSKTAGTANTYDDNTCATSDPTGLCEDD